jgi:glucose-6-phosphate isomerase
MPTTNVFLAPPAFLNAENTKLLQKYCQNPPDLTHKGFLNPERIAKMTARGAGWTYSYAFQRVDDAIMEGLLHLAKERKVFEQMEAMQKGEMANFIEGFPSDRRAVLHTAERDLFGSKPLSEAVRKARELAMQEHKKLEAFMAEIDREDHFTDMIFVGIGGSLLGPQAFCEALAPQKCSRRVSFVANVDPFDVNAVLKNVTLSHALVVIVSKSGSTQETATNEEFLRREFIRAKLDPKNHFIAVTSPKSKMDDSTRYRAIFYIPEYVGGRFSASTKGAGLPISFLSGFSTFDAFLKGAHAMDLVALEKDPLKNLPLLAALLGIWNRNFLKLPVVAIATYCQRLRLLPAHIQQVDMESNGKRIDRCGRTCKFETGPHVYGGAGTIIQHSFFQLLHQSSKSEVLHEFIGLLDAPELEDIVYKGTTSQEKLVANMLAQILALAIGQANSNPNKVFPGNRPSTMLIAETLTPEVLGALLAFYEHKIAFQGFIWGINSFDQEGVQLGKTLADEILGIIGARREKKAHAPSPLADSLLTLVDGVAAKK